MAHLLHVDASSRTEGSASREVAAAFRRTWLANHPDGTVDHLDLAVTPPTHLIAGVAAPYLPEEDRTPEHTAAIAEREDLVGRLVAADAVLMSLPMYNLSIPSQLKAWIDQVFVMGRTVQAEVLPMAGRPLTVVIAYGGSYAEGTPRAGLDFARPYLEAVFGQMFGMQVTVVPVELTMAAVNPAMVELKPLAEASFEAALAAAAAYAA